MAKMQRDKGQRGERELLKAITAAFEKHGCSVELHRNHAQTEQGGADCLDLPGIALEVKRQENLAIPAWWRQAIEQAGEGMIPVLGFRQNRKPWCILIPVTEGLSYPIKTFQKRTGLPPAHQLTVDDFATVYPTLVR